MSARAKVLGILNVTPDSFSDGGEHLGFGEAIAHAEAMAAAGADIIDVGGESTRPGAGRVEPAVERERILPVIEALAERGMTVSVDTMNASTAAAAIDAGAQIVNDVSGGLADRDMASVVAAAGVRYVAMHWRGPSDRMASHARYGDVVDDVRAELDARVTALLGEGIRAEQIVLDPGLGFAKDAEHNWRLLARLGELGELGYPVLVGASRKRFLGALPARGDRSTGMEARDLPTAVVSALAARDGVWGLRVHDVGSTAAALDVVEAWSGGARA